MKKLKNILLNTLKALGLYSVSKRKFIITYHTDGNLEWTDTFFIEAHSKDEAIKEFNMLDFGSCYDIADVYAC